MSRLKFNIEEKYRKIGFTAFLVIVAAIIFAFLFMQLPKVGQFLALCVSILKPVIYGIVIAYLVSPFLRYFEDHFSRDLGHKLFPQSEEKAWRFTRFIGVFLAMVLALSAVAVLIILIAPRLTDSLRMLISNYSIYTNSIQNWIAAIAPAGSDISSQAQSLSSQIYDSLSDILQKLTNGDMLQSIMSKVFSSIYSGFREVLNVFIGIVVAVYVLVEKEKFGAEGKKLLYALLPVKVVNSFLRLVHEADETFGGFIAGKIIDSVIIGILTYVVLAIFRMPYKELISVIVGVTNIIPFFGPFIGAVPGFLIIFLVDPIKGLIFLVIIFGIQQFDGNILGPRILGQTVGIGSFWIIVAILLGGGLFNFPGMVFGVPVFALFYTLAKHWTERQLARRGLPEDTEEFKNINYIDPVSNEPVLRVIPDHMGAGTQDEEGGSDTETSGE